MDHLVDKFILMSIKISATPLFDYYNLHLEDMEIDLILQPQYK